MGLLRAREPVKTCNMNLDRIAPYHAFDVSISWSRPVPYAKIVNEGSIHDVDAWLYMILGYRRSSHPRLFYIGQVQQTQVSQRLRARDHRARYQRLCHDHPQHSFQVSLGAVTVDGGHITKRRVDHIEHILIYATFNSKRHVVPQVPHMINKRLWFKSGWPHPYIIRNNNYRTPLPKEIHVGVFTR